MQRDGKTILHDEERSDVKGVLNADQRSGSLQEDLLLPSVDVDEDVRTAFRVGALDLLRVGIAVVKLLPAVRLQTHVLAGAVDLKRPHNYSCRWMILLSL